MSLTSYLSGKSQIEIEFQSIIRQLIPTKNEFSTLSGKKPFSSEYEAIVPTHLVDTFDSTLVGTAYDYLARLSVGRVLTHNKGEAISDLCAKHGLDLLKMRIGFWRCRKYKKLYKKHLSTLEDALYCRKPIGILVYMAVIFLARLEIIFRSGKFPGDISVLKSDPPKYLIKDLVSLLRVFEDRFIEGQIVRPNSEVIFNPHFGPIMSMCIGGADADIYIDGTLYDFKTTKNFGYRWQDIAQVVGYYLLYLAAIAVNEPNVPLTKVVVDSIALYKARFGEIEKFRVFDLGKENVRYALMSILRLWNLDADYEFDYQYDQLFAWYESHQ